MFSKELKKCFCFLLQVIDIAAGGWHSVAISVFNDLYAWGWNVNGQLGLPIYQQIKESKVRRKNATVYPSPELVNLFKQRENDSDEDMHEVCQVAAGLRHTLVKTNDGTLLSAGWNKYGQLGFDRDSPDVDNFVEIESIRLTESDHIICGDWSTLYFKWKVLNKFKSICWQVHILYFLDLLLKLYILIMFVSESYMCICYNNICFAFSFFFFIFLLHYWLIISSSVVGFPSLSFI